MSAEKEAFEKLYYPMSALSNFEKFNDFCKGWRAATEAAEALKPPPNISRDAIVADIKKFVVAGVAEKASIENLWWVDTWVEECFDSYAQQSKVEPQADNSQSAAVALCKRAVMYAREVGDIPQGHPIIDEMAEVANGPTTDKSMPRLLRRWVQAAKDMGVYSQVSPLLTGETDAVLVQQQQQKQGG